MGPVYWTLRFVWCNYKRKTGGWCDVFGIVDLFNVCIFAFGCDLESCKALYVRWTKWCSLISCLWCWVFWFLVIRWWICLWNLTIGFADEREADKPVDKKQKTERMRREWNIRWFGSTVTLKFMIIRADSASRPITDGKQWKNWERWHNRGNLLSCRLCV